MLASLNPSLANPMNFPPQESARRYAERGEWGYVARLATEALAKDNGTVWALHLRGVAAYRQGRFREAFGDLERAAQLAPDASEILDHLGAAAAAIEDWPRAAECFREALRIDPKSSDAAYNLAKVCRAQNDDRQAVELLRFACESRPTFWEAYANLANALRDVGSWAEAEAAYREALALRPGVARTWNHLGVAYLRQRRYAEAREAFERALACDAGHVEARINLGNVLRAVGELDAAAACYRLVAGDDESDGAGDERRVSAALSSQVDAVAHAPRSARNGDAAKIAQAQLELANQLRDSGRGGDAIGCYYEALRRAPDRVAVWNALGSCLLALREFDEARDCFEKALAIAPDDPRAENNLAAALIASGRLSEGRARLARLVAEHPDYAEARSNLGAVLHDLGDFVGAEDHLAAAAALSSEMPDARWNRALLRLRRGEHGLAWTEYEWRWRRLEFCRGQYRLPPGSALDRPEFVSHAAAGRTSAAPVWSGEPLAGKTILAFAEQGLGDAIQFVRFVAPLRERGGNVVLEMHPQLAPLFRRGRVAECIVAQGEAMPAHDYQVALMSLPAALGVTEDTDLSVGDAYLEADKGLVRAWASRLEASGGLRVGIHWQGNPNYCLDRLRSPPLSAFRPLADLPGVRSICLQHGFGRDQLAVQDPPMAVEVLESVDRDRGPFMDTAAILTQLDLVVTSDSALAHLAGALGVQTWLVLPHVSDWRWGVDAEKTPWYPSMRLFRQRDAGNWDEVFCRVADAVKERLAAEPR